MNFPLVEYGEKYINPKRERQDIFDQAFSGNADEFSD
jgi:hypothetical protein